MAKKAIPSHPMNSFLDGRSVSIIEGIFYQHAKVASDIKKNDKWPNTDGAIDIHNKSDTIACTTSVQVKTLSKSGVLKFSCSTRFLKYCRDIQPVMLLVADHKTEKVYWVYLDPEAIKEIGFNDTAKTRTVDLLEEQSFDKKDKAYIEQWIELLQAKKNRFNELSLEVENLIADEIDIAKQLIDEHRYSAALKHLEKMREQRWDRSDGYARFRILTNTAVAKANLNQPDSAAELFLQAYSLQPKLELAKRNKATAHLLRQEYQEALSVSEEVLKDNPIDPQATSVKIRAMALLGKSVKQIAGSIDSTAAKNDAVLSALSTVAHEQGLKDKSIEYLEYAVSSTDDPHIIADLGTALLEKVIKDNATALKGKLNATQTSEVQRAIKYLKAAWESIHDKDDRTQYTSWLYNRAAAHRLLSFDCEAESAAEELLDLMPDNEEYIQTAIVISIEAKKYELAELHLRKVLEDKKYSNSPVFAIMLVDVLKLLGKNDEALKLAKVYLRKINKTDNLFIDMNENIYDLYIVNGKFADALRLASQLVQGGHELTGSLFAARAYRLEGEAEKAVTELNKAIDLVDDDTYKKLIVDLAEESFESGRYDHATNMYSRVVVPNSDTYLVQRYLKSLYEIEKYQEAIDLSRSVREIAGATPQISQFEWASYLELQDLPNARIALKHYLDQHSDDQEALLQVAVIDFRIKSFSTLDTYLQSDINLDGLSLLSKIQLSNLLQARKLPKKSLEVLYCARRSHPNDADAHSAYISLFLGYEKTLPGLHVRKVQADVVIRYEAGYFIIEGKYEPNLSENEISVGDAKNRGFFGKKKGESIVLSSNRLNGDNKVEIIEVVSKYVHAFQESLKNYEKRFTGRNDLMGFNVGKDNFDPLFKELDRTSETSQSAENLYTSGAIPLDSFAKLLGKNIIEVCFALHNSPAIRFKVAEGTLDEITNARAALSGTNIEIVADITALISLHASGVNLKAVGLPRLVIAQRTKDLLQTLILQTDSIGRHKTMTIYKNDGQYIRHEISAEEQIDWIDQLNKLSEWIDQNTVVAGISQQQVDEFKALTKKVERMDDMLSEASIDTMRLSLSPNRVLFIEDLTLRKLSQQLLKVPIVWTQGVLIAQLAKRAIRPEIYHRVVIKLCERNYYHISVNAQTLAYAAEKSNWVIASDLETILTTLSKPEINTASLAVVISGFIYLLYSSPITTDVRRRLIGAILVFLTASHDKEIMLPLIKEEIAKIFVFRSQEISDINSLISSHE